MAQELGDLAHSSRASLAYFQNGVYLWRIRGARPFTFAPRRMLPAWAFGSQTRTPVVGSAPKNWYVVGLGQNGNVLDQAYWREAPGLLHATVTYASMGPLWLQVWNATTEKLITQRFVPTTNGHKTTATLSICYPRSMAGRPHVYAGFGPWDTQPVPGQNRNELEIRVDAQATSMVSVYAVGLTR